MLPSCDTSCKLHVMRTQQKIYVYVVHQMIRVPMEQKVTMYVCCINCIMQSELGTSSSICPVLIQFEVALAEIRTPSMRKQMEVKSRTPPMPD
jgi:hypothetical protein